MMIALTNLTGGLGILVFKVLAITHLDQRQSINSTSSPSRGPHPLPSLFPFKLTFENIKF
jgi:hypothetical protein